MSHSADRTSLRQTLLHKLTTYSQKAAELGWRVRQLVFGFRLRSTAHIDRWALPVKLLHDHRILQRRRAFKQAGGSHSSMATHALEKARQHK
ncbi:MAG: hypothetical protein BroJett011_48450 [Chloroflexota bacterium]|nr:MAG: hypothetical protein BroJett011_48450 [Chloroflexota bacterium]